MPRSDTELLSAFARSRDERAFEELVFRHLGLVLGAARRRLAGRHELAEEVAQNVFVTLARKAGKLRTHPCLPAWLQKTAAFEAMRASRKEKSHLRKIKQLDRETSSTSSYADGGDPHMEAALPVLDEAMASLPESDRRALMLRFYEGRSFKIIGMLSGKSEAACQKQARRAIDKLGALLQRRGVVMPATTLVAGLTAVLTQSAPAKTATSIATAALAPGAATTTSALIPQLTLMNTKTSIAIGTAVLIACAGSGYFAGVAAKQSGSSTGAPSPGPEGSARAVETSGSQVAGVDKDASVGAGDSLRRLLNLARSELQGLEYDITSRTRGKARIARIPFDQIPAALELVAAMPGGFDVNDALTDALLERWAQHDGIAACEFSLANRTPPTMGLTPVRFPLTAWAEEDPQAALSWYLAKSAEKHPALREEKTGRFGGISNIRWIMQAWIHRDMEGAAQAFLTLDEKYRDGASIAFMEHAGPLKARLVLLDMLATQPMRNFRDPISDALGRWSSYRPAELARWIDENPLEGINKLSLAYRIMPNWLTADREAALQWWDTLPQDAGRSRGLRSLIGIWADRDLVAAGEWLAEQDLNKDYDAAILEYSRKAARREPAAAMAWARSIENDQHRIRAVEGVANEWAKKDPAAARREVEASDLPGDRKAKLLESAAFQPAEETP